MELLGLSLEKILAFTVIGSIVTVVGSLIALFIKEYFLVRSFENWKLRNTLKAVFQKYRDPILLSSRELCNRLNEICAEYPSVFLNSKLLKINPKHQINNSQSDPYYQKHKLVSTLYRLCAFLGWLELYRQDITYLDSGQSHTNDKLDACMKNIRADLADGHLNKAPDWEAWRDVLIFREQQRAIGEAMIRTDAHSKTVIGFGSFCESLLGKGKNTLTPWTNVASNFLLDLRDDAKDFRKIRLQLLLIHLVDLNEVLQPRKLPDYLKKRRDLWQKKLREFDATKN